MGGGKVCGFAVYHVGLYLMILRRYGFQKLKECWYVLTAERRYFEEISYVESYKKEDDD